MHETIVGLKEFRENVDNFAKKVSKGISFIVVKRSKPIFRVAPLDDEEERWKTVIDLTKINPRGVSIEHIMKAIRNGQSKKSHSKTAKKI